MKKLAKSTSFFIIREFSRICCFYQIFQVFFLRFLMVKYLTKKASASIIGIEQFIILTFYQFIIQYAYRFTEKPGTSLFAKPGQKQKRPDD